VVIIRIGCVVVWGIFILVIVSIIMNGVKVKISQTKLHTEFNNLNQQGLIKCQKRNMMLAGLIFDNQSIKTNCYTTSPFKFYKIK